MTHTIYKITYLQMVEGFKKAGGGVIGSGEYEIKGIRTSYCYGAKGLDELYGKEFWNDIGWWYEDWMENDFTKYKVEVLSRFETQDDAFAALKKHYLRIGAITEDDIDADGKIEPLMTNYANTINYDPSVYFGIYLPKGLEREEIEPDAITRLNPRRLDTSGHNNKRADLRKHTFSHKKTGETFTGTRIEFIDKYYSTGVKTDGIAKLVKGVVKSHRKWVYAGLA